MPGTRVVPGSGRPAGRIGSGPEYINIRRVGSGPDAGGSGPRTRPDPPFLCQAYAHTLTFSDTQLTVIAV